MKLSEMSKEELIEFINNSSGSPLPITREDGVEVVIIPKQLHDAMRSVYVSANVKDISEFPDILDGKID